MTKDAKIIIVSLLIFFGILLIGYLNKKSFDKCVEEERQECWEVNGINCLTQAKERCEFKYGGF